MGIIKEYVDRAVQTETATVPSPYADPAVVLAAPPVTRRIAREAHIGHHDSISGLSPATSDCAYTIPQSPSSPMLAPLVSRQLPRHRHTNTRYPAEIVNRRVVSMPENKSVTSFKSKGKRIVSMPDRVRPVLEPSAELFQSPSTVAGESFGSHGGHHDRARIFHVHSDPPQTPSPPSSPESLLIIATGTQLPEGFLRRKYSPEPLVEEDEDWITWANSPPRPIPALHGPLSLPYARCPSGAEGTIIEEPDNVAQMIWGLGSDDQPHNQARLEGRPFRLDNPPNASSQGAGQVPRLQKKTSATQQARKSSQPNVLYSTHTKQGVARTQRQTQGEKRAPLSRVSPDIETRQDVVSDLPWNEGQPIPVNARIPDNLVDDTNALPVNSNRILEWQLACLRQALRTSLVDMDSCGTYPGRLEPIIPPSVAAGLPQSYPRIFVEPRLNESVSSSTRQSSIDISHQYRQQQLYRQALQKQKLQMQNLLPTPPNSSSPQWSSHFSPYMTCCSTFSPESAGSTEHLFPVSQKYRSGTNASQYLRRLCDLPEHDNVNDFDTSMNISSAKIALTTPNINPASPLKQSSSSSSTLAKYIKQLQALSPITQLSTLQTAPPNTSLPPLPLVDESIRPLRAAYTPHSVPTPPSPESPQTQTRGSSYRNTRSVFSSRPMSKRLSSVPEEDGTVLELPAPISLPRPQTQVTSRADIAPNHDGTTGHQIRYIDAARRSDISEVSESEGSLGAPSIVLHHETSPVKVRLPVTNQHDFQERTGDYQEHNKGPQHGHRKKHRYKKPKGSAATNEQATTTRGLVG